MQLEGVTANLLGTSTAPLDMMHAARASLSRRNFAHLMAITKGAAPTAYVLARCADAERAMLLSSRRCTSPNDRFVLALAQDVIARSKLPQATRKATSRKRRGKTRG